MSLPQLSIHTPFGAISLAEEDGALVALDWGWGRDQDATPLLVQAREQMNAYFDGELTRFRLPLAPSGTAYRQRVWSALIDLPYGRTGSYGEIASTCGGSSRAVGQACRQNPLPIIIPCHRVVGAAGLGGYSAGDGVSSKRALLQHEQHWRDQARDESRDQPGHQPGHHPLADLAPQAAVLEVS